MPEPSLRSLILNLNEQFYRALSLADIELMSRLWHHSPIAICVHPGWDQLIGWPAIRQSWQTIFTHQGPCTIAANQVILQTSEQMAWLFCHEHISGPINDDLLIRTLCINIFERREDEWKMIAHQASIGTSNAPMIQDSQARH